LPFKCNLQRSNEAVDRTHLAEFHQVEGVICDKNLTLVGLRKLNPVYPQLEGRLVSTLEPIK
jgi:phenylalanyl-tRNA synthetase alpha subunit